MYQMYRSIDGTSAEIRYHVVQANVLVVLLDILGDSPCCEASMTCMDVLSQLLCDKPRITFVTIAPTIPRLVKLLDIDDDPKMLSRVFQILSDLWYYGDTSCIQAVIGAGAKPKLTILLSHQSEAVVTSALRALRSGITTSSIAIKSLYLFSARKQFKKKIRLLEDIFTRQVDNSFDTIPKESIRVGRHDMPKCGVFRSN